MDAYFSNYNFPRENKSSNIVENIVLHTDIKNGKYVNVFQCTVNVYIIES